MIKKVKKIIGIAAGKGGVGKSTVSVNLALALKECGFSVGLLDADIYGPSLMKMLCVKSLPKQGDEGIIPAVAEGICCMSMAFFNQGATIVRAPIANQVIHQFLHEVEWGELDFLLVDFPPGTGDVQLTLLQEAGFCGIVIVTTPQEVALIDVQKTVEMIQKASVPIYGVVENMSYFEEGGKKHFVFGSGGGARLAESFHLPLLAEIPIDPQIGICGDSGQSLFEGPRSKSGEIFLELSKKITEFPEDNAVHFSLDEGRLKVEWTDGLQRLFKGKEMQRYCPCILCRNEKAKELGESEMVQVNGVGNYGLKIQFSHGCSSGIYPFSLLRGICSN